MGLLDFLRARPKNAAQVDKDRLRIVVTQEHERPGCPDYLPLLRRELLAMIHKYVNVDAAAVDVQVTHRENQDLLELSIALPDKTVRASDSASGET
ncbi:MAG: cell division topological specificity factor MinE [Rhodanobacteraceae bacterium]